MDSARRSSTSTSPYTVRKALLDTIEEITFKKSAGEKILVVGARKFATNQMSFDADYEVEPDFMEYLIQRKKMKDSGKSDREIEQARLPELAKLNQ